MEDYAKGIVAKCYQEGLPIEKTAALLETALLDKLMQDPDIQHGMAKRLEGLPDEALQKLAGYLRDPGNRRRLAGKAFSSFVPRGSAV